MFPELLFVLGCALLLSGGADLLSLLINLVRLWTSPSSLHYKRRIRRPLPIELNHGVDSWWEGADQPLSQTVLWRCSRSAALLVSPVGACREGTKGQAGQLEPNKTGRSRLGPHDRRPMSLREDTHRTSAESSKNPEQIKKIKKKRRVALRLRQEKRKHHFFKSKLGVLRGLPAEHVRVTAATEVPPRRRRTLTVIGGSERRKRSERQPVFVFRREPCGTGLTRWKEHQHTQPTRRIPPMTLLEEPNRCLDGTVQPLMDGDEAGRPENLREDRPAEEKKADLGRHEKTDDGRQHKDTIGRIVKNRRREEKLAHGGNLEAAIRSGTSAVALRNQQKTTAADNVGPPTLAERTSSTEPTSRVQQLRAALALARDHIALQKQMRELEGRLYRAENKGMTSAASTSVQVARSDVVSQERLLHGTPTAPFTDIDIDNPDEIAERATRRLMVPPLQPFTGTRSVREGADEQPFSNWISSFEQEMALAKINRTAWLKTLRYFLQDAAAAVYDSRIRSLPHDRRTYQGMVDVLRYTYDRCVTEREAQRALCNLHWNPKTCTIDEFYVKIEKTAASAYPQFEESERRRLVTRQFIEALPPTTQRQIDTRIDLSPVPAEIQSFQVLDWAREITRQEEKYSEAARAQRIAAGGGIGSTGADRQAHDGSSSRQETQRNVNGDGGWWWRGNRSSRRGAPHGGGRARTDFGWKNGQNGRFSPFSHVTGMAHAFGRPTAPNWQQNNPGRRGPPMRRSQPPTRERWWQQRGDAGGWTVRDVSEISCFNCTEKGHYARTCTQTPAIFMKSVSEAKVRKMSGGESARRRQVRGGAVGSSFRDVTDISCFNCDRKGHYARDCSRELTAKANPSRRMAEMGRMAMRSARRRRQQKTDDRMVAERMEKAPKTPAQREKTAFTEERRQNWRQQPSPPHQQTQRTPNERYRMVKMLRDTSAAEEREPTKEEPTPTELHSAKKEKDEPTPTELHSAKKEKDEPTPTELHSAKIDKETPTPAEQQSAAAPSDNPTPSELHSAVKKTEKDVSSLKKKRETAPEKRNWHGANERQDRFGAAELKKSSGATEQERPTAPREQRPTQRQQMANENPATLQLEPEKEASPPHEHRRRRRLKGKRPPMETGKMSRTPTPNELQSAWNSTGKSQPTELHPAKEGRDVLCLVTHKPAAKVKQQSAPIEQKWPTHEEREQQKGATEQHATTDGPTPDEQQSAAIGTEGPTPIEQGTAVKEEAPLPTEQKAAKTGENTPTPTEQGPASRENEESTPMERQRSTMEEKIGIGVTEQEFWHGANEQQLRLWFGAVEREFWLGAIEQDPTTDEPTSTEHRSASTKEKEKETWEKEATPPIEQQASAEMNGEVKEEWEIDVTTPTERQSSLEKTENVKEKWEKDATTLTEQRSSLEASKEGEKWEKEVTPPTEHQSSLEKIEKDEKERKLDKQKWEKEVAMQTEQQSPPAKRKTPTTTSDWTVAEETSAPMEQQPTTGDDEHQQHLPLGLRHAVNPPVVLPQLMAGGFVRSTANQLHQRQLPLNLRHAVNPPVVLFQLRAAQNKSAVDGQQSGTAVETSTPIKQRRTTVKPAADERRPVAMVHTDAAARAPTDVTTKPAADEQRPAEMQKEQQGTTEESAADKRRPAETVHTDATSDGEESAATTDWNLVHRVDPDSKSARRRKESGRILRQPIDANTGKRRRQALMETPIGEKRLTTFAVSLNGRKASAQLDTRSPFSLVGRRPILSLITRFGHDAVSRMVKPQLWIHNDYFGNHSHSRGTLTFDLILMGYRLKFDACIDVMVECDVILGMDVLSRMGSRREFKTEREWTDRMSSNPRDGEFLVTHGSGDDGISCELAASERRYLQRKKKRFSEGPKEEPQRRMNEPKAMVASGDGRTAEVDEWTDGVDDGKACTSAQRRRTEGEDRRAMRDGADDGWLVRRNLESALQSPWKGEDGISDWVTDVPDWELDDLHIDPGPWEVELRSQTRPMFGDGMLDADWNDRNAPPPNTPDVKEVAGRRERWNECERIEQLSRKNDVLVLTDRGQQRRKFPDRLHPIGEEETWTTAELHRRTAAATSGEDGKVSSTRERTGTMRASSPPVMPPTRPKWEKEVQESAEQSAAENRMVNKEVRRIGYLSTRREKTENSTHERQKFINNRRTPPPKSTVSNTATRLLAERRLKQQMHLERQRDRHRSVSCNYHQKPTVDERAARTLYQNRDGCTKPPRKAANSHRLLSDILEEQDKKNVENVDHQETLAHLGLETKNDGKRPMRASGRDVLNVKSPTAAERPHSDQTSMGVAADPAAHSVIRMITIDDEYAVELKEDSIERQRLRQMEDKFLVRICLDKECEKQGLKKPHRMARTWDTYGVFDGVVYYVGSEREPRHLLCVPYTEHEGMMQRRHEQTIDGKHLKAEKVLSLLAVDYYWPRMKEDIKHYCEECPVCDKRPGTTAEPRHPTLDSPSPEEQPFGQVRIEVTRLPTTRKGNTAVLGIVDLLTGYLIYAPMKNDEPATIARKLNKHLFTHFALPKRLASDNATTADTSTDKTLKEEQEYGREATAMMFYNYKEQERAPADSATTQMLAKMAKEYPDGWDELLSDAMRVHNDTPTPPTGKSPYLLLFGRTPVVVADLVLDWPTTKEKRTTGISSAGAPGMDQSDDNGTTETIRITGASQRTSDQRDGYSSCDDDRLMGATVSAAAHRPAKKEQQKLHTGDCATIEATLWGGEVMVYRPNLRMQKSRLNQDGPYDDAWLLEAEQELRLWVDGAHASHDLEYLSPCPPPQELKKKGRRRGRRGKKKPSPEPADQPSTSGNVTERRGKNQSTSGAANQSSSSRKLDGEVLNMQPVDSNVARKSTRTESGGWAYFGNKNFGYPENGRNILMLQDESERQYRIKCRNCGKFLCLCDGEQGQELQFDSTKSAETSRLSEMSDNLHNRRIETKNDEECDWENSEDVMEEENSNVASGQQSEDEDMSKRMLSLGLRHAVNPPVVLSQQTTEKKKGDGDEAAARTETTAMTKVERSLSVIHPEKIPKRIQRAQMSAQMEWTEQEPPKPQIEGVSYTEPTEPMDLQLAMEMEMTDRAELREKTGRLVNEVIETGVERAMRTSVELAPSSRHAPFAPDTLRQLGYTVIDQPSGQKKKTAACFPTPEQAHKLKIDLMDGLIGTGASWVWTDENSGYQHICRDKPLLTTTTTAIIEANEETLQETFDEVFNAGLPPESEDRRHASEPVNNVVTFFNGEMAMIDGDDVMVEKCQDAERLLLPMSAAVVQEIPAAGPLSGGSTLKERHAMEIPEYKRRVWQQLEEPMLREQLEATLTKEPMSKAVEAQLKQQRAHRKVYGSDVYQRFEHGEHTADDTPTQSASTTVDANDNGGRRARQRAASRDYSPEVQIANDGRWRDDDSPELQRMRRHEEADQRLARKYHDKWERLVERKSEDEETSDESFEVSDGGGSPPGMNVATNVVKMLMKQQQLQVKRLTSGGDRSGNDEATGGGHEPGAAAAAAIVGPSVNRYAMTRRADDKKGQFRQLTQPGQNPMDSDAYREALARMEAINSQVDREGKPKSSSDRTNFRLEQWGRDAAYGYKLAEEEDPETGLMFYVESVAKGTLEDVYKDFPDTERERRNLLTEFLVTNMAMQQYNRDTDKFNDDEYRRRFFELVSEERFVSPVTRAAINDGNIFMPKSVLYQDPPVVVNRVWQLMSARADRRCTQLPPPSPSTTGKIGPEEKEWAACAYSYDQAGSIIRSHFLQDYRMEPVMRYVSDPDQLQPAIDWLLRQPNLDRIVEDKEVRFLGWDLENSSSTIPWKRWHPQLQKIYDMTPLEKGSNGPFPVLLTLSNCWGLTLVIDLRYTRAASRDDSNPSQPPTPIMDLLRNANVKLVCFDLQSERSAWYNTFGMWLAEASFIDLRDIVEEQLTMCGNDVMYTETDGVRSVARMSLAKTILALTGDFKAAKEKATFWKQENPANRDNPATKFMKMPEMIAAQSTDLRYAAKDAIYTLFLAMRACLVDFRTQRETRLKDEQRKQKRGAQRQETPPKEAYPRMVDWVKQIANVAPIKMQLRFLETEFTKGHDLPQAVITKMQLIGRRLAVDLAEIEERRDRLNSEMRITLPYLTQITVTAVATGEQVVPPNDYPDMQVKTVREKKALTPNEWVEKHGVVPVPSPHEWAQLAMSDALQIAIRCMDKWMYARADIYKSAAMQGLATMWSAYEDRWRRRYAEEPSEPQLKKQLEFEHAAIALRQQTPGWTRPLTLNATVAACRLLAAIPGARQTDPHILQRLHRQMEKTAGMQERERAADEAKKVKTRSESLSTEDGQQQKAQKAQPPSNQQEPRGQLQLQRPTLRDDSPSGKNWSAGSSSDSSATNAEISSWKLKSLSKSGRQKQEIPLVTPSKSGESGAVGGPPKTEITAFYPKGTKLTDDKMKSNSRLYRLLTMGKQQWVHFKNFAKKDWKEWTADQKTALVLLTKAKLEEMTDEQAREVIEERNKAGETSSDQRRQTTTPHSSARGAIATPTRVISGQQTAAGGKRQATPQSSARGATATTARDTVGRRMTTDQLSQPTTQSTPSSSLYTGIFSTAGGRDGRRVQTSSRTDIILAEEPFIIGETIVRTNDDEPIEPGEDRRVRYGMITDYVSHPQTALLELAEGRLEQLQQHRQKVVNQTLDDAPTNLRVKEHLQKYMADLRRRVEICTKVISDWNPKTGERGERVREEAKKGYYISAYDDVGTILQHEAVPRLYGWERDGRWEELVKNGHLPDLSYLLPYPRTKPFGER